MRQAKGRSRTLVFGFDGTGNAPNNVAGFMDNESISNVLKLHVLMGGGLKQNCSLTRTPAGGAQEVRYYSGIGSRQERNQVPLLGALATMLRQQVNKAFAPTFGDARRIVEEAMEDFAETGYSQAAGDQIVVLGYSRGAALARKFVSVLLNAHAEAQVAFVGVFDTVAAFDGVHRQGEVISSDVVFENGTVNERVRRVVHILSLDEDRVTFSPTLINKDEHNPDRILEIWFPGVHGDIGGGYWLDGLSDAALAFMAERCRQALAENIRINDGSGGALRTLFEEQGDQLAALTVDDIALRPLSTGPLHRHSGALALASGQAPRSVCVNDNDQPSRQPSDLPLLHWSVKERFDVLGDYKPAALRGLKFRIWLPDGSRSETLHGIAGLREYQLP